MERKGKQLVLLGAFIVLTILGYYLLPKEEIVIQKRTENEVENVISGEEKKDEMIFVHIEGAVNFPGMKEVPKGTRLFELVEIAGGVTEDADVSKVNLASILRDEQKIWIPFQVKVEPSSYDSSFSSTTVSSENVSNGSEANLFEEIININWATEEELQKLPGIGPSMAKKILEYRIENGAFHAIDDLKNVAGIGEAKFDKIKEWITI